MDWCALRFLTQVEATKNRRKKYYSDQYLSIITYEQANQMGCGYGKLTNADYNILNNKTNKVSHV